MTNHKEGDTMLSIGISEFRAKINLILQKVTG